MLNRLLALICVFTACGAGDLDRTNPNDRANARCGNASLDPGEVCDDGNAIDDDNCRRDCTLPFCGDGVVRRDIDLGRPGYEECDDANNEAADGCSASCLREECGNGVVDPGEDCDDGNSDNEDRCTVVCRPPSCGDGLLFRDEQCDDGNQDDDDACRNTCLTARCGDGMTRRDLNETEEGYEACDDGNRDEEDGCASTCRIQGCGDGVTQSDEVCDDGDTLDNNACRADCQASARCNDGVRRIDLLAGSEDFEECDDGNRIDYDACTSDCLLARCGDGVLRTDLVPADPEFEECDDSNDEDTDACLNRCTVAVCNDGVLRTDIEENEPGWEACDDGNDDSDDNCTVECREPACRDGFLQDGEECDDGNNEDADGCTNTCVTAICGDEIRRLYRYDEEGSWLELSAEEDGYEGCDDGNEVNDDACLNNCRAARCGDAVVRRDLLPDNGAFYEDCEDGNEEAGDGCSGCRVEPVQVAASQYHACLRLADGRVSCAGRNNARVLGRAGGHSLIFQPVAGLSGVRSIAAGRSSSCAIKQDGTLWCWGYVTIGGDAQAFTRSEPVRVGDHNNIERVWVGESNYTICYITAAQSLFCVGNNRYYTLARQDACFNTPCAVGPSGAVGVALADEHTCVLLNDGQIYCWGNNLLGELGRGQQGEATDRPQRIQGISGFAEIGAGRRRTCARHNSGTIYCWGDAGNQFGYLGNGQHTGHSATPVQVDLINDAVGLAVGPAHACATRQGGAIYCWGAGRGYGQSRERLSPRSIGIVDNIGLVLENAVTYMLRNQHLYWLGYNYAQNPTGGGRSVTELTAWDH